MRICPTKNRRLPARAVAAVLLTLILSLLAGMALAAEDEGPWSSGDFSGLKWRGIGPAIASGRVGDIAVDPRDPYHWYVAVCSGNVWETRNAGVTFTPIFDDQGSYSIGCVALAPSDPDIVWVGTGENNSQRSVAYGDGIYKSVDGGASWKKMGLERSLHIGRIQVHPQDPNVVWVAAMGPLWGPGGDRGLYKTTDGGETWTKTLDIDENTGVVDVVLEPGNPDVLYAASYQRRRHIWTLIDGGPGSGIYKSVDGGETWTELKSGLPSVDKGRIGLAVAQQQPRTVYAIVEAAQDKGGFFRSTNGGATWEKMSGYVAGSPQYYNEIVPDPVDPDRVYSEDTYLQVTEDGGKTWRRLSTEAKHVDDHALWIDPGNTQHLVAGCDGGVYESFDRGETWRFFTNLPVTQFYRVAVDYDEPFYNLYGGTQDNNTIGGPARTTYAHGASNREWFFTLGGDGFEPAVDPTDPDIVYCQLQYGNLVRWDRKSGERLDIQPQPVAGEVLKWNWNSALLISPHDHNRLYYACQKIFCSDDRGHSWRRISGDLTRGIDRNKLEVMDTVWGVDTVAKNNSTSFWGSIISLSESPLTEGLIYAGTDDGLIQVTRDGGQTWTATESFKGVPDQCYVSDVEASRFEENVVYATFDNHKRDDFAPYVLKSGNYGKSWQNIAGNLPERGTVYTIVQDHVDPNLLFVGTEFGVFFTVDEGGHWTQLKAGMPTICTRDLEIQRRENDLVAATFGRGFYILDDYTPLRELRPETLEQDAAIFPVKDALIYIPSTPIGSAGQGHQGNDFWLAKNPPFGAVITYYLKDGLTTLQDQRREAEQELRKEDKPVYYPSWDELRTEDRELDPEVILTIKDDTGEVVRRFSGPRSKGFHRVAWDLRWPELGPVSLEEEQHGWYGPPLGPFAEPGTYSVTVNQRVRGEESVLAGPVSFDTKILGNTSTPATDFAASVAFQHQVAELYRALRGANRMLGEAENKIEHMRKAVTTTPDLDRSVLDELDVLGGRLADLRVALFGDRTISSRSEPTTPGLQERVARIIRGTRNVTCDPTQTQRDSYAVAADQFENVLAELTTIVEVDLVALEKKLEDAGAPFTPGRMPVWKK